MARASKRARLDDPSKPPAQSKTVKDASLPDKHALFTTWSKARGVEIGSVAPQTLPGRGVGLVTTAPITNGERLLFIPEKAMFKHDDATIQKTGLGHLSPQAKLTFTVMSRFMDPGQGLRVWSATWPTLEDFRASMPLWWASDLTGQLPHAVLAPLERQRVDYDKDWAAVKEVCATLKWQEEDFKYYWCIVNSRSFHWKQKHIPGRMVLCPFIDYTNHGPTGSGCQVTQGADGYEAVADRDYVAGEEVLFTYGAHSNDKLLVHYGFVCTSTKQHASADDEIRLDHIIMPQLSTATKSRLQDTGFLGAYALLPSDSHAVSEDCDDECEQPWDICFKTQVAVRAEILTCNEWEYFVANGEDLSGDASPLVRHWLLRHLRKYHDEAVRKVNVEKHLWRQTLATRPDVALELLRTRWEQIRDALDNYHNKYE